ncbi:MAG TPA: SdpI family protein [Anaerolineales bacterium]|nr:SdpI family protein [Anaerolineales bacterium]
MTLLIPLYAAAGLLLIVLAIPFIRRRIGINHWAGLRIPPTTEHPGVWYPANRYAGWWLLSLGILNLSAALLLGFWPGMTEGFYVLLMTGVLLGGLGVGLFFSWRHASGLVNQA